MSHAGFADRRSIALAYVCGAGCAALVAALLLEQAAIAAAAKLIASTAFVLMAISGGALQSRSGALILAGLALSWLGDAFLIGKARHWFLLGLTGFLLAHVAYVSAFLTVGVDRRWTLGAIAPVAVIGGAVLLWLQPYLPQELVWPVRFYTAVISLMVITAFGTLGAGATPLIVSGACLFYLSDLSVAALRFTEPAFPTYVFGLPLYYAAQICLAFSVPAGDRQQQS